MKISSPPILWLARFRRRAAYASAFALLAGMVPAANAFEILGTGTASLLGNDLTDPENDGDPEADTGYNAIFDASEEPDFAGGESAFNIFDNVVGGGNDKWCCGSGTFPLWATATFPSAIELTHFTVASANDTPERDPRVWEIQGSNDGGTTFETIFRQDDPAAGLWTERNQVIRFNQLTDFPLAVGKTYSTFRFITFETGLTTGAHYQVAEVELFGSDRPVIDIDFNSALPDGVQFFGTSKVVASGGVDDTGYLSVTDALNGQVGSVVFPDVTGGLAVSGFTIEMDLRVGGGTSDPADGFSFNFVRPNDPLITGGNGSGFSGGVAEEGSTTGLGIGFDEWDSGNGDVIGFSVRVDDVQVQQVAAATKNGEADDVTSLQTGPNADGLTWQPFKVAVTENPAGGSFLNLFWKGEQLLTDFQIEYGAGPGQIVMGGRTGNANSNHHVDNIFIELIPAGLAIISKFKGNNESISAALADGKDSQIDRASIKLTVDGTDVTANAVIQDLGNEVTIDYAVTPNFPKDSTHTVLLESTDTLGNSVSRELEVIIPGSSFVSGGKWTTTHAWSAGDQLNDAATSLQLINGEIDNQGILTLPTSYIHFDDNSGPPLYVDQSLPFPLWDPANGGEGRGDREDFAIQSIGQIVVTEAGKYFFVCNSDDGFNLTIDGELVGEAPNRGRGNTFMEVDLEAGIHDVDFVFWERGGGAGVSLYVSRDPADTQPAFTEFFYELVPALDILNPPLDGSLADNDGDDLPDVWEEALLGNLSGNGSGDSDSDGLTNAQELANTTNPGVKDTDGDGLEDGAEVNTHGSNPRLVDTDGDTLSDAAEVNDFGTDPADADSDDDGALDSVEVNPEFATDPNNAASVPDVIVAVRSGPWMAPATWGGTAPVAGKKYATLKGIANELTTTAGTFAGDSLTLIGSQLTLAHSGSATVNLVASNATIESTASNTLAGRVTFVGASTVDVGTNELTIDARFAGSDGVTLTGGTAGDPTGDILINGPASEMTGNINIIGTRVSLLSANGLGGAGDGDVLLSGGGLAIGAPSKFCGDLFIQGDNFALAFAADLEVKNLKGLDPDSGAVLFDLHRELGNITLSVDSLINDIEFNEDQTSGTGNLILNDALVCAPPGCDDPNADTDGDGVSDCDETLVYGSDPNSGDTDSDGVSDGVEVADGTNLKGSDSDQDGLSDGEEKTLGSNPLSRDTDGDGFSDAREVELGLNINAPDGEPALYRTDFAAPEGAKNLGDSSLITDNGDGVAKIVSNALQLTEDAVGGSNSSFKTPIFDSAPDSFTVRFEVALSGGGARPADGFAFGFGNIGDTTTGSEQGFGAGTGLAIEFDTYDNAAADLPNDISLDISVDGTDVANNSEEAKDADPTNNTLFNFDGEYRPVEIVYTGNGDGTGLVTVTFGGTVIHQDVLVAWAPAVGNRAAIAARTGGATETVLIDNFEIIGQGGGGTSGGFLLDPSFAIPAGTNYNVEFSTDLLEWEVIANDQTAPYTDTSAGRTGQAQGFYRAVTAQ